MGIPDKRRRSMHGRKQSRRGHVLPCYDHSYILAIFNSRYSDDILFHSASYHDSINVPWRREKRSRRSKHSTASIQQNPIQTRPAYCNRFNPCTIDRRRILGANPRTRLCNYKISGFQIIF